MEQTHAKYIQNKDQTKYVIMTSKVVIFFSDLSQSERRIQSNPFIYLKGTSVLIGRYNIRSKSKKIEAIEGQCLVYMETGGLHNGGKIVYALTPPLAALDDDRPSAKLGFDVHCFLKIKCE
jgi:hypothetical protein